MWGKHEHDKSLWKDAKGSEARKKNWDTSVNERAIYLKYLIFRKIWKIPWCCLNFPCVVCKFLVFSLSAKIEN